MSRSLLSAACHAYAVAAVAYLIYLVRLKGKAPLVGALALLAGFLTHAAVIVARYKAMEGTPVSTLADGLSFMAWLMVGTYLVLDRIYRLPAVGAFVTPLALSVTVAALMVPQGGLGSTPLLGPAGVAAHVLFAFLGMAFFALATGVAGMYVLQERQMKGKRFGFVFTRLPSLEVLDEINRRLVLWGFALLSGALVSGAVFAKQKSGAYLGWDAREGMALCAWFVFAGLIMARLQGGWRGRRVAALTLAGFGILLGSFVALFAFPGRDHGGSPTSPSIELSVPGGHHDG